jgi:hypothetical protein
VEYLCDSLFPFENAKKQQQQQQEIHGPWTDVPAELFSDRSCITQSLNLPNTVLYSSHDEIVKLAKKRTGRAVITVNIM